MTTLQERLREAGDDYTVEWGSGDLYYEAADRLDALEREVESLRKVLTACLHVAEWQDKRIHPAGASPYQNWMLRVYLPVPINEHDKSVERALNAAIDAARSKTT